MDTASFRSGLRPRRPFLRAPAGVRPAGTPAATGISTACSARAEHRGGRTLEPGGDSARTPDFVGAGSVRSSSSAYREALLHLLISQTSCFRYWGEGRWGDYARELCRRGKNVLERSF